MPCACTTAAPKSRNNQTAKRGGAAHLLHGKVQARRDDERLPLGRLGVVDPAERAQRVDAALRASVEAPSGVAFVDFPMDHVFSMVADDHHPLAADAGEAAEHSRVIAYMAIAMQLLEVGADGLDVVEGVGALRMAGHQDALPRGEIRVNVAPGQLDLLFDGRELGGHVDIVLQRLLVKGFELFLEFAERFLEFEEVGGSLHKGRRVGGPAARCQRTSSNVSGGGAWVA